MEIVPEQHVHSRLCHIHNVGSLNIQKSRCLFEYFPLVGPLDDAIELMCNRLEGSNTLISVGMVRHPKFEIDDIVGIHVVIELLIHTLHYVVSLVFSPNRLLVH